MGTILKYVAGNFPEDNIEISCGRYYNCSVANLINWPYNAMSWWVSVTQLINQTEKS